MRIIISPAKQMKRIDDCIEPESAPVFLDRAKEVYKSLQDLSFDEAKKLWGCSEKLAIAAYDYLHSYELDDALTPAVLSFDGIAFKYMAPSVFEYGQYDYVQERLRIISGLYGVLRPLDKVVPYRLEMQAKARVSNAKNLYDYWGDSIYQELLDESRMLVNLASKEYSKCIEPYLQPEDTFVTCVFGELQQSRVVQKGVYCKMARGEMVRYMAVNNIERIDELKAFSSLDYRFDEDRSDDGTLVFLREPSS